MDQIKELEAKIADIKNQIGLIDRGEQDAGTRDQLVDQLNILTNQMAELTFNQEKKAAAIEEKVHAESVPFAIEGVDFLKLPPELIKVIELVVKADRHRSYTEHAIELEQVETERNKLKTELTTVTKKYTDLETEYETCARELAEQTAETLRIIAERDDAKRNRDNAANQLTEKDAQIAQLQSQVDDYQKAKVFGEREAQNVIEAKPAEAEEINTALKKLYVTLENWGTVHKAILPDGTFDVVPTAELDNWAPIAPVFTPPSNGGSEDNNTFQDASETTIPGNEIAVPEAQVGGTFPTPPTVSNENNAGSGDTAISQVVGETITERLAALEVAVFGKAKGKTEVAA